MSDTPQKKIEELENKITYLSKLLAKSFTYAQDDPDTFLQNARRTTEAICKFIYQKEIGEEPKKKMMLSDLARELYNKKTIPERIGILIGTIQTYGNYGAHAQEDFSESTREWIAPCQTALANLSNWFFLEYMKGEIPSDLAGSIQDYADRPMNEPIKDLVTESTHSKKKSKPWIFVATTIIVLTGCYLLYTLVLNNRTNKSSKISAEQAATTGTESGSLQVPTDAEAQLAEITGNLEPFPNATRIAVLYFDSDDPNIQNLRKGLADMMITDLSKFRTLNVIERAKLEEIIKEQDLSNSKRFNNTTATRIGKLLGVECILIGSYFEMMGALRIDARIIDVETGKVLKSEGVDGPTNEFFSLEKELVKKLITQLDVKLNDQNRKYLIPTDKNNITYENSLMFSKGLEYYDKGELTKAKEIFETLLKEYPEFEPAKNAYNQINI